MRVILICFGLLGVVFGAEVKIRAGQTLVVRVMGVADSEKGRLDNLYSVSKKGKMTMWKIGAIQAAGKTKAALAEEIAAAYRKAGIYEDPVFLIRSGNSHPADLSIVTIGGQVRMPRRISWEKGMTLADTIEAAGGLTPYGAEERIRLYRQGEISPLNNKDGKARKILLYPGDFVEVTDAGLRATTLPSKEENDSGVE